MYGINELTLLGTVSREPTIGVDAQGEKIARVDVATTRPGPRGRDGNVGQLVEWHRLVLAGRFAVVAEKFIARECRIFVQGQVRYSLWRDAAGVERQSAEVWVCDDGGKVRLVDYRSKTDSDQSLGGGSSRAPASDLDPREIEF